MTLALAIAGIVVFLSLLSAVRFLRRLIFPFVLAFAAGCALWFRTDPAEASAALGVLGGGVVLLRPVRRAMFGRLL